MTPPPEAWKNAIDAELGAAGAVVQSGMPADRIDLARAQGNDTKPAPDAEKKGDTTTVFQVAVGATPVRGKATASIK